MSRDVIAAPIALNVSTKAQAAYEQVRRLILEGHLPPGEVIQQEQLAAELGLSTTPLREALRRLDAERLVILDAHRRVAIPPLSFQELDEIYVVRRRLDCLAAGLAAGRVTVADAAVVRRLATHRVGRNPLAILNRNRQFHRAIYRLSGNNVLTGILDSLWDRGDRYRVALMYERSDIQAADQDHSQIADAFAAGAGDELEQLMSEHLARSQDSIRSRLQAHSEHLS